jgi:hypothetical protein
VEAKNIKDCYDHYYKAHDFSDNEFLIIQLKRFSNKMMTKNRQNIEPDINLKLPSVSSGYHLKDSDETVNYILIGVIIHIGDKINSGQYTYYSQKNKMLYPDEESLQNNLNTNGYIFLYYKKVKTCKICTFENEGDVKECAMCGGKNFVDDVEKEKEKTEKDCIIS